MPGMKKPEYRFGTEIRAIEDEDGVRLEGYAALFESDSLDLGGFIETIRKGAFSKTLKEKPDVRAFWNHNSDIVLGRTVSETLEIQQDKKGLRVVIHPPENSQTRSYVDSIKRGDVDGMSFSFRAIKDEWTQPKENGPVRRELIEVELFEVSPCSVPAYPETSISARAYLESINEAPKRIEEIEKRIGIYEPPEDRHSENDPIEPEEEPPESEHSDIPDEDPDADIRDRLSLMGGQNET